MKRFGFLGFLGLGAVAPLLPKAALSHAEERAAFARAVRKPFARAIAASEAQEANVLAVTTYSVSGATTITFSGFGNVVTIRYPEVPA